MSAEDEYPYQCTLTPELIQKAEKELNEKETWRNRDIQALRDMVVAHKGLKCPLDSAYLLRFLRARKFDYEKSYQLLIDYYTIRVTNADILKELTPSAVEDILDYGTLCMLPVRDKLGRKIMYLRPGKWNPDKFAMLEILRVNLVNLEHLIKDEETQVNGLIAIGNISDVGMTHVKNIDRNYFRITSSLVQDAFPMRFKGMHFINEPAVFGYIFSIVKTFLKQKMIDRIQFHGSSLDSLQSVFDKSCLPQELGGDLPPGDELAKTWKKSLMEEEKYFQEMMKFKIEIPKNIFGSKTLSESTADCIKGSYKKIGD